MQVGLRQSEFFGDVGDGPAFSPEQIEDGRKHTRELPLDAPRFTGAKSALGQLNTVLAICPIRQTAQFVQAIRGYLEFPATLFVE